MRIRKFNESNQNIIQDIRECFIDLVEETLSEITIDEALYFNEENSEFWVCIGLPCLGFDCIIKDGNNVLSELITYNNILNSRYEDIMNCIEKVKLLHSNIEYHYEIHSTEIEKINIAIHLPYIQYIEIVFKI